MDIFKKKTIGVFFGGRSPEHEVSIITGELIISELRKMNYSVIPIYISKKGEWYIDEKLNELKFFSGDHQDIEHQLKNIKPYCLCLNDSILQKCLILKQNKFFFKKKVAVDIAFPAFHGINGEDGTIQGMFEVLNIPYVGSGVFASSIAMDKALTLMFYKSQNIPAVKFLVFKKALKKSNNLNDYIQEIKRKLSYPIFVKPARLGSSIGISKVNDTDELESALELAFSYDNKIVIEQAVDNLSDLTCAVLEKEDGTLITSLVQESIFDGDFFDYRDKYLEDGGTQLGENRKKLIIPAKIDKDVANKIKETAKRIFKLLDCSGMARIDFLYDRERKQLYVGEVNTIPGTLYHHLWKASGISLKELLKILLTNAITKHKYKKSIDVRLNTDILHKANSLKLQADNIC